MRKLQIASVLFPVLFVASCMSPVKKPEIKSASTSKNTPESGDDGQTSDSNSASTPGSSDTKTLGQDTGTLPPAPTPVGEPIPTKLPADDYLALKCKIKFDPADTIIGAWVSGDGGRSVRISSTRTVWMFSDTWLGSNGERNTGAALVGNTVATSDCGADNKFAVNYYWKLDSNGGRSAFFPDQDDGRFWLLAPFYSGGNLYQTLQKIVPDGDGGAFGFKSTGITLSRISNPKDKPSDWKYKRVPLIDTEAGVPGTEAVVFEGYVYLFSVYQNNVHITRVQELALDKADDARGLLEYLTNTGEWKKGYNVADAKSLGMLANSGMTIRKNGNKWQMVFMDTKDFPFSEIKVSLAEKLEGPWGEAKLVYSAPETKTVKDAFCYTAYEQPDYASDAGKRIALTYSCNTLGSNPPAAIYSPHMIEVDNPFPPSQFGR